MRVRSRFNRRSVARRGFTLLEVLVAVAILGLGLTAILSAQTGLFASSQRTERLSFATGLLRCRMTEIELKLLRDGFPLIDESEQGRCCEEEESRGFDCEWKIDKVELPEATELQTTDGDSDLDLGAIGALASIEQTNGAALGAGADLSSLAGLMGGASAAQSMAPMVMSLVYPNLKPMLEASIRRVTVTVKWKEGSIERDLSAVQFLTQPQQGGLTTTGDDVTNAANQLMNQLGLDQEEAAPSGETRGGSTRGGSR